METRHTQHRTTQGVSRRHLLQAGLATGATLATWPLYRPAASWSAEAGPPRRGGILRARGWDPPHFDPHLTRNFMTHSALSFVYNKLLRHKVGPDVQPGTFIVEPDLAERWEAPDDTTYIFYLRQGVKWHNKKITAMVTEQRRTKDPEARQKILVDFQRYAAEQQYYVYLFSAMLTSSSQPYMKNFSHNLTFDYGSRVAEAWLDR